jgi:hypothetical protein
MRTPVAVMTATDFSDCSLSTYSVSQPRMTASCAVAAVSSASCRTIGCANRCSGFVRR